jgi:catechol 2,3-dioxygenase-like lactoylglutathione lyase family enzyme
VTLGVSDLARSVRFYETIGFPRKMRATGDEIAFFDAGGVVLALWHWHKLADDAGLPPQPRPQTFRGSTLAINCRTDADVDARLAQMLAAGARLLQPAHKTSYGGYCCYFADPDGHAWEIVRAPGFDFSPDGRLLLPD